MTKPRHIAIVLARNRTDVRARLSGVLRFFASKRDITVHVLDPSNPSFSNECARLTSGWTIDGCIFSNPAFIQPLLRQKRRSLPPPLLAMLDGPRSFDKAQIEVRMDVHDLTDKVVALLRRRGYANFAFCGTDSPFDNQYSAETESSFFESAGRQFADNSFHESPAQSYSKNLQRGADWVRLLQKPCAVMCYSDEIARDLLNACNYAHVNVPEQVAIVGMDDSPEICEMTRPSLSSALPDFELSGYLAAKGLYRALETRANRTRVTLQTYGLKSIVERKSTQDVRCCGRIVSAAMELIRLTPATEISADFLSRRLHVSRRILELHFKKVVGNGVHAEISRMRLESIRKLLTADNLPIERIAESCGYRTVGAAQVAFKKRYGISMRTFRNNQMNLCKD